MKYRVFISSAVVAGFLATASFAANTLSTGGHEGIVRAQSANLLGKGGVHVGGALEYSRELEYIHSLSPDLARNGLLYCLSGVGYLGLGVSSVLDFSVNLPAYYDHPNFGSRNARGIGDLELSAKLADFWLKGNESVVTAAYYLAVQFPTGQEDEGFFPRHAYFGGKGNWSAGQAIWHPMIMTTINFNHLRTPAPLRMHFNLGGVFNAPDDNDAATAAMGLEIFPVEWLTIFTDVSMEERFITVHKDRFFYDLSNDPIFITPGVKFSIPKTGLYLTLAGDIGISESDKAYAHYSTGETGVKIAHQANMLYSAYLAIGWKKPLGPKDKDGDGIYDPNDKCPAQFGVAENGGCPDVDTDQDGMVDRLDKCSNSAEDKDAFQDEDGCPDADNDNDGIPDDKDKCPLQPGVAENGGCPDLDTDGDGIVDRLDNCPSSAEDKDGFQDDDGCQDTDNDGDGVPDNMDNCPKNPGVAENQGCPKSKEIQRGQLILKGVNFESGKAILLMGSFKVLDEMSESLREWPEVSIEIQGHTDNTGLVATNIALSQSRAETVRQYLITKGIAPDRLSAVGYGQERPIADNKTAAGRAQNRRVEINRIK